MEVIFDSIIYDLQTHGGVSVYFSEILKRAIQDPDLLNSEFLSFGNDSKITLKKLGINNIHEFNARILERYREVKARQGKIKNKVFHSSYYRLPQDKGIPVVTTVHDFTYEKYISGPPKWVHSWQKYKAIKHSELLICVSNNTAKDLMEYCGVDKKKIRVIHNGVSEIYRPLGDYQRDNSIVFIGARGGYKNFDVAVRALKHLSDFRMVIVGGGVLNNDEITLLEHNIPGRYEWLGRLTDEELNLQYNKAYCLIYPSSYEGFGIPIIEAMRAGCPVIAINNSSIPEVAGDAAILIEYAEAELVVEAVQSLHTDYNKLRLAGLSQASHFSWDKCYSATKKIYKELS